MVADELTIHTGETPSPLRWSLLSGFFAFALDFGIGYVLRLHSCSVDRALWLRLLTIVCLAIALSGLVIGQRFLRRLPRHANEEGGEPYDRAHFQALLGMAFSIGFAIAILAVSMPRWILRPCD
jgi:hypothetical protein